MEYRKIFKNRKVRLQPYFSILHFFFIFFFFLSIINKIEEFECKHIAKFIEIANTFKWI